MKERHFLKGALVFIWFLSVSVGYAGESAPQAELPQLANSHADLDRYVETVQSSNGLTLGVSILQVNRGTNTTELPIGLVLKASGKEGTTVYLPKEEYLVRLELYDSAGGALPKSRLGSKYGRKFDDLHWDPDLRSQPHGHPEMIFVKNTWTWICRLPPTSELFMATKPGTYHLKVQVQLMLLYLHDKQVKDVLRFAPVEMAVTHPDTAQRHSPRQE